MVKYVSIVLQILPRGWAFSVVFILSLCMILSVQTGEIGRYHLSSNTLQNAFKRGKLRYKSKDEYCTVFYTGNHTV